jgi:hypothetical protein
MPEVASLEGNNLVVFYYLGPPEIWLDSMVAFCGSGHIIWVVLLNYFPQERQPILYGHSHKKQPILCQISDEQT